MSSRDAHGDRSLDAPVALDAAEAGIWVFDFAANAIKGDQLVASVLDLPDELSPWPAAAFFDRLHDDDVKYVHQAFEKAKDGNRDLMMMDFRAKPASPDNQEGSVWIRLRGKVTSLGADGRAARATGLAWRVPRAAYSTSEAERVLSEVNHRVNNSYAVIRALANLGESSTRDVGSFADTLRNQVEALAATNKLSTEAAQAQRGGKTKVRLNKAIEAALASRSTAVIDATTEVQVHCPDDVWLSPADLTNFAMILFELAANASKSGAFRATGGAIAVAVRRNADQISLQWDERSTASIDPPRSSDAPTFGEVILELCASNLDGVYYRSFGRDGVTFQLDFTPQH